MLKYDESQGIKVNKAHAATYAYVSYITAWLKYHYPVEYLCSAMLEQGDKTSQFVSDCRQRGIEIYAPDVNKSECGYTPYKDGILVGLSAIKGLNEAAMNIVEARKDGLFTDILDFAIRSKIKSNNVSQCILSGACDMFTENRVKCNRYVSDYMEAYKEMDGLVTRLAELEAAEGESEVAEKRRMRSIATCNTNIKKIEDTLAGIKRKDSVPLSVERRLQLESQYLGMWVTGNPMDEYDLSNSKYKTVGDVEDGFNVMIPGIVLDIAVIKTKKGDDMAFFNLVDKTGNSIKCIAFPETYESLKPSLKENSIFAVSAGVTTYNDSYELIVSEVKKLTPNTKTLLIESKDIDFYARELSDVIKDHRDDSGINCKVRDLLFNEIRTVAFKVNVNIIEYLNARGFKYIYN